MPDMTSPAPAEAVSLSPAPCSVLLLQGLMVPLFCRLGPRLIRAGHRVLIERCLTPGGFFSDEALEKVVRPAIARFEGRPLAPE